MRESGTNAAEDDARDVKRGGRVYTPPALATFLARRALDALPVATAARARLGVLDPACGEGALLEAVRRERPGALLHGVDVDGPAVGRARRRLGGAVRLACADFLADGPPAGGPFDVVVANPPYVRTQALGAARAATLRRRYGLTGRVDLLHAFVAATAPVLAPDGVLAFLGSNRFLTTRAGAGLRRILSSRFEVLEVLDLGDTRLFDAAVLPALVVARARAGAPFTPRGTRVYLACPGPAPGVEAVLASVEGRASETADGTARLRVERGSVERDGDAGTWRIVSAVEARFLATVRAAAPATFGELLHIRVGVKTTADAVFVRDSFAELPAAERPEAALLRPLLRRQDAAPFVPLGPPRREILYPHESVDGRRRAVDLARFPRARAYLERHRARLAGRRYVREAGRRWYELWVPHEPDGWRAPKVVWPDIDERPRFFLDRSGAVVPGNCYWLTPKDGDPRLLRLVLAIANSEVAVRWYDATCGNRLYHGRRRFITQYVARFPLPDPDGPAARRLLEAVEARLGGGVDPRADAEVDATVRRLLATDRRRSG